MTILCIYRPSVSEAPRANIRPMASPTVSTRIHANQPVRGSSVDNRAMASIRPVMAVTQRTATVNPTTYEGKRTLQKFRS